MDNFYPTKHFINNNLTTLGERQLRRNASKAHNQGAKYVRKIKNARGHDKWMIDANFFHLIGERERNPKKNIQSKPKISPKNKNHFGTEVSLNFKDSCDYDYYQHIAEIFHDRTGIDIVYKIEREFDSEYSNHLHMGVATFDKKKVTEVMKNIVEDYLNRSTSSRFNTFLSINEMIDDKSFIGYISKGYDGLGGDFPEYILA